MWAPFAAPPYLAAVGTCTVVSLALLLASPYLLWPLLPNLHSAGWGLALPVAELLLAGQPPALSLFVLVVAPRPWLTDP